MTRPTPPRLQKAKAAAVTTAVVATTAALTAGVGSAAPEALLAQKRTVEAEVALAALPNIPAVPDIVGIYGVGPIFWAADLLGLTPTGVIQAAAGLLGGSEVAGAVTDLLDLLELLSPIEAGIKGPLPGDVYDAVNGLDYSTNGVIDMLGDPIRSIPLVGNTVWNAIDGLVEKIIKAAPILNQRRAVVFSESLGGVTTSLAYRDMINAVRSNAADWEEGVTGQWLIFFNNPSRPGGGLFALATPFTNQFGLNLSTPPAGSYTNEDENNGKITKVLNTSILDVTWAYNILSDAPTTANPLAWANAATGAVFLTYLLPNEGNNILNHVAPLLLVGVLDGAKVMIDPTGGQGLDMVPGWTELVTAISKLPLLGRKLADVLDDVSGATKFPGTGTYITYDSGNLPLLEPFRVMPHLLNLIPGTNIPTPLTDSIEDALRMMVNMGYQDVDPDTLERGFDMADQQAYFYDNPLTPTQQLAAQQKIFNALVDGIQEHALNPAAWTPSISVPGIDFQPIVQNAASVALMAALRDALEGFQDAANPAFTAVRTGLAPVTKVLDDIDEQVTKALDSRFKVTEPKPTEGSPLNLNQRSAPSITNFSSDDAELRTITVTKEDIEPVAEKAEEPVGEQDSQKDSEKKDAKKQPRGLKKVTESFKATPGKHALDANNPVKKSVQETVEKVNAGVTDAVKNLEKAAKDAKAKAKAKASASKDSDKKSGGADSEASDDKAAA
ncbi:PE-PPE domain-containing protein [Mycolicibacterium smegmatis]|uniref:PE-PPE domain-containing protein n=1 Tax=Mycolicibacterium smegmatis TaxID=1772 RepID=UPI001EFA6ED5|nr:PE-PPE domain-containing protein [Mycolicibacterium smegmatis]MCP2624677.1 PE-PPE domain-containing protein [Mycolicibacterium smegmatis]ULN69154.1 PE-PPE domain-containing protein [Mycolicibacterium smegmatis]